MIPLRELCVACLCLCLQTSPVLAQSSEEGSYSRTVVTLLPDGTLAVAFYFVDGTMIGHGGYDVKPTDPKYEELRALIGEIEPGQTKLVPPLPPPSGPSLE